MNPLARSMRFFGPNIFKIFLLSLTLATGALAAPGQRYDVQRNDTKIYASPSAKAPVIGRLKKGDRVIEWSRKGPWVEVSQMGVVGKNGWIHISRLREESSDIEIKMSQGGHFMVQALVNGKTIDFIVDTGASSVVLNFKDAEKVGFNIDELAFRGRMRTARGVTRFAPVILKEIKIGRLLVKNVVGAVNQHPMEVSLLGMTFLGRLRSYRVVGDRLLLSQ